MKKDSKTVIISSNLFDQKQINGTPIVKPYVLQKYLFFRLIKKTLLGFFLINKKELLLREGTIIVFDSVDKRFLCWLNKNKHNRRIIFWYWNPVELTIKPKDVPNSFEKWTYSKSDSIKYNLCWNTQFGIWDIIDKHLNEPIEYDVVFIGRNKGRKSIINLLDSQIKALGYSTKIIITRRKKIDFKNPFLPKPMPYNMFLLLEAKSKAIIDFGFSNDVGLTVRAMEALYYNKKIICNYSEILESNIPSDNIFYLTTNHLNPVSFVGFMNNNIHLVDHDVIEYYSFSAWLDRFN